MQNPDEPRVTDDAAAPRRAIYLLPNLFTTGAMFAGFFAIVAAMNGRFASAAVAVLVAGVLDGLDGRIARLTNTQSDFGKQLDSLADMLSFGVAPALVMYLWALEGMAGFGWFWSKVGWLAAFFYTVCAAMRLARFNTQAGSVDRRWFIGLPSPSAAGLLVTFVWVGHRMGFEGSDLVVLAVLFTIAAGALMVSRVRYYSFADLTLKQRVSFPMLVAVPLIFILIALNPPRVLFLLAFGYVTSGAVIAAWRLYRRRKGAEAA
jgi:CDP-diacylglycerol---serine O-phosphatidyltransferase